MHSCMYGPIYAHTHAHTHANLERRFRQTDHTLSVSRGRKKKKNLDALVAELIIDFPFLGVGEHVVGLYHFFFLENSAP